MRRDNGTQFTCNTAENFLLVTNTPHERIHPATPKEDAYIESFNLIPKREVYEKWKENIIEGSA